jgi:AraC-like DNA-binding protein
MMYQTHVPGPPLNQFIDFFWLFDGGHTPRKERILPSGTNELVINLRNNEILIDTPEERSQQRRFSGAVLSGTYEKTFVVDAMQHEAMLGVHFKPGGALRFLKIEASELLNAHANLGDLWGLTGRQLREVLCEARTPAERFQIIQNTLLNRLRIPRKEHAAVKAALNLFSLNRTCASVRDVAREVGLCERRFRNIFAAQVGLTPKMFCRILRFQRAGTLAVQTEQVDWAQIAETCGYFDQSHLINDFQHFSGFSPIKFVRRLRQHRLDLRLKNDHIPLTSS